VSSTLTGVWPWVSYAPDERLSAWGIAGYGDGSLTLDPEDMDGARTGVIRTGLDLWLAGAGLRGVALDRGKDGLTLAVKTDAMIVRTGSDAASGTGGNLAAAEAEVTRLRLGLEGSRPFRLADGSTLTDAVLEEVRDWQNRPLDGVYPVVFFDALRIKIRDEGLVRNKAVYLALAITYQCENEVLGLWIEQTEGAKFWFKVMNELRTRGVGDILIAVVDGLTGFPDATGTVFPQTAVQTCIVHLIRNSLAFVFWKDRKKVMPDLRAIYRAETAEAAAARAQRCGLTDATNSGDATPCNVTRTRSVGSPASE